MPAKFTPDPPATRPPATPLVLDVRGNSLDDGPGIRTVIFFKGCPLSCTWCHNPESQRATAELGWDARACIGCNQCVEACPRAAIVPDRPGRVDRSRCDLCFRCVEACPAGALERLGTPARVADLVRQVETDLPFFRNSGGGVTLSGGEPTLYLPFVGALTRALAEREVPVLLETCGYFPLAPFLDALYPHLAEIYFDLKLADPRQHARYCGVPNARILANFQALHARAEAGKVPVLPRIPLVPGVTATRENLTALARFLRETGCSRVALLEYNPTWHLKAAKIGQAPRFSRAEFMSAEEVAACRAIFADFTLA